MGHPSFCGRVEQQIPSLRYGMEMQRAELDGLPVPRKIGRVAPEVASEPGLKLSGCPLSTW